MKEVHLFYAPEIASDHSLPQEEATHAVRVLRMKEGDEVLVTDGVGNFYECTIAFTTSKSCTLNIERSYPAPRSWRGNIHLAVAPTKNMDRMEWLAEKATEIGWDRLSFILCKNSERIVIKTERIEKIVVSAMKQSHKAHKPVVEELVTFKQFISKPWEGEKYIAHCLSESGTLPFLYDILEAEGDATVLIGPEGDFSAEEVAMAEQAGFQSISLGESRLRTETAALVATYQMNLAKRK